MTATELRAKRKELLVAARAILDAADTEGRKTTAEEDGKYSELFDEAAKCAAQVEQLEGAAERRKNLDAVLEEMNRSQGRLTRPGVPGAGNVHGGDGASASAPFVYKFKRKADPCESTLTLRPEGATRQAWLRHQPDYRQQLASWMGTGITGPALQAALQTDLSTGGGYMVMPEQFVAELLMNVDDQRWIRKLARTFTTMAQSLGVVKRTNKMAASNWGSELSDIAGFLDTTLAYGKRSLTPHYMVGGIKVSRDLLRSALLPVDEYVRYEIARDAGELEENAFLTGTGAQQPLGIFTATPDGIDTSRDISTGNATTQIGADNLREMKYSLKAQYQSHPSLRWLFHRLALKQISKLKDGEGQYLWKDGISDNDPDRLLGIPVVMSEFAPSTFTTGKYVGILGAWYWYWIVDSLEMDLQVLYELFTMTNQIGYIWRKKTDGMPQLAEAFVRCTLA